MKKILKIMALLWCATCAAPSGAISRSQGAIPADVIRLGCSVLFLKQFQLIYEDYLSNSPYDVSVKWHCDDGETATIDKYEINGSNPEIVTFFYWKRRNIVVLVKWSVNSQASNYVGDYYKIFSYRYRRVGIEGKFVKNEAMMMNFPPGWDGRSKNGERITYPFKDAASIRKQLKKLNVNN